MYTCNHTVSYCIPCCMPHLNFPTNRLRPGPKSQTAWTFGERLLGPLCWSSGASCYSNSPHDLSCWESGWAVADVNCPGLQQCWPKTRGFVLSGKHLLAQITPQDLIIADVQKDHPTPQLWFPSPPVVLTRGTRWDVCMRMSTKMGPQTVLRPHQSLQRCPYVRIKLACIV